MDVGLVVVMMLVVVIGASSSSGSSGSGGGGDCVKGSVCGDNCRQDSYGSYSCGGKMLIIKIIVVVVGIRSRDGSITGIGDGNSDGNKCYC